MQTSFANDKFDKFDSFGVFIIPVNENNLFVAVDDGQITLYNVFQKKIFECVDIVNNQNLNVYFPVKPQTNFWIISDLL